MGNERALKRVYRPRIHMFVGIIGESGDLRGLCKEFTRF